MLVDEKTVIYMKNKITYMESTEEVTVMWEPTAS